MVQATTKEDLIVPNFATNATKDSVVCPPSEDGVTNKPPRQKKKVCKECGEPAFRSFCSGKCRQAAYRRGKTYAAALGRAKVCRLDRRNRWLSAKLRDKSFTFDGRHGGHMNLAVPALGQFERYGRYSENAPVEHYLVRALQQILN